MQRWIEEEREVKTVNLQSVKLCRSQEKQLGEDGQIIPIQAPGKTQHKLGNKLCVAPSRQCGRSGYMCV